eukprot:SAG11_NODE_2116_length_3792_cov_5.166802_1_plen_140_part_00
MATNGLFDDLPFVLCRYDFPLVATDLWSREVLTIESLALGYTARGLPAAGGHQMLITTRKPTMLPHLRVPHCADGLAIAEGFGDDSTPPPSRAANQSTSVSVCWDGFGLHFRANASDDNIFNSAAACNAPVFSLGGAPA